MDRTPVQSSNLASVGYDSDNMVLEIEFLKGGIYQYSNVAEQIYNDLINASSKGKYFDQNIKKAGYPYTRVG